MEKAKGKKLFYRPAGKRKGMYTPTQIICVSFVIVIALGTFLLSLPVASKHGRLDVLDAMFTATSATCVTGLIVRDTWTQFTYFGQAVILLLIQVGGLGLVTLTSFFAGYAAAHGLPRSAAAGRKRLSGRICAGQGRAEDCGGTGWPV